MDRRRAVRHARHRRRRTALLGVVAGSAIVAGGWWLGTGPMLSVTSVEISGYRQPDQPTILRTVQIAARHGTMLRLPTVEVRESLARYPWVQDVSVHHNWLRGIDVRIVQATPAAIAVTGDGRRLVVSDAGRVLGEASEVGGLPTYRVPALTVGAWLRGPAQRAPFEFLRAMSPEAGRRVHDLRLEQGVVIGRLATGADLRLGPPRQLWAKGRAVEAVLGNPRITEKLATAGYLDVSAPKQPTLGGFPADTSTVPSTEGQPLSTG
jgi:POTRA domain-containing FtsQ-type protein